MKNMKEIGESFMFFRKGGEGIRKNQECGKYWLWNHFHALNYSDLSRLFGGKRTEKAV